MRGPQNLGGWFVVYRLSSLKMRLALRIFKTLFFFSSDKDTVPLNLSLDTRGLVLRDNCTRCMPQEKN